MAISFFHLNNLMHIIYRVFIYRRNKIWSMFLHTLQEKYKKQTVLLKRGYLKKQSEWESHE